jgi:hypothetical protein
MPKSEVETTYFINNISQNLIKNVISFYFVRYIQNLKRIFLRIVE